MAENRHLQRLQHVWQRHPVYFITTCAAGRRPLLATPAVHHILRDEWKGMNTRHGWAVGRYVIMPDHVHFFMTGTAAAKPLSRVMAKWKEWTAKRILAETGGSPPVWQPEFFDHVLRSEASRSEKWAYVFQNPVRAGLLGRAEDWPYSGAINFE
jgi:REP element-mobilizing transposase RayT